MSFSNKQGVEQLRARFEGREAIYIEKGALRVRVFNIGGTVVERCISAEVEEIPTAGFPTGTFCELREYEPSPMRWSIEAGHLTTFSERSWHMGYGGWSLYFAPRIVEGAAELALRFPENLDPFERYNKVLQFLKDCDAHEPAQPVFAQRGGRQ